MTREWYDNRENVAALLDYLEDRCELGPGDAAQVLLKPWKWQPEYNAMRRAERAAEVAA